MAYPSFYHPSQVGQLFTPQTDTAVRAGKSMGYTSAKTDTLRTVLLLVDPQIDFIHTDGTLSVPGAVDDTRRIIEWIFRNAPAITDIVISLDSHVPQQIFSPSWWHDAAGNTPEPFTVITSADVHAQKWLPVYEAAWSLEYVERLEETAKKQLMIWPYHTLIGTPGHSITPALYEAIVFHAASRNTQPSFITKGTLPSVEHYSIFEPEVKLAELPDGGRNSALLDHIATFDSIYVAGQAKSHCVLESVTSMMRYYEPETIRKVHLLTDAMSSVVSPGIDFDQLANASLQQFAAQGLVLTTTDQRIS